MDRQTITVDIAPEAYADRRLKVSQYDVDRPLGVYILQNGTALDCSNYAAYLYITKPDHTVYEHQCQIDGTHNNLITWSTEPQETVVAGISVAEIRIVQLEIIKGALEPYRHNIGTANFTEWIEESPADLGGVSHCESQSLIDYVDRAEDAAETAESSAAIAVQKADIAQAAVEEIAGIRIVSLDNTVLSVCGQFVNAVGSPVYVDDVTAYSEYGIQDTGWYIFARIFSKNGILVTAETAVSGASGSILTIGADHVDIAVKFDVAAMAQIVLIDWGTEVDRFVFNATDLAVRNLDYRTTFYVYDIAPFARWEFALTPDATFAADTNYYTKNGDVYTLATVTTGEAVPAYYTLVDEAYTQATGVFEDGITYYTKTGSEYTEATVTVGEEIPAYYKHSKIIFEGMARNITYQFDDIVDCPSEFVLPAIEDDGYGAWFEIRLRHSGSFSSTLVPVDEEVKIATEHTQAETAGFNMIDLHYMCIDGVKIWRFMNTHSTIPAAAT